MLMFLMIMLSSALVLALSAAVFAGVNHEERKGAEIRPELKLSVEPARFFVDEKPFLVAEPKVPIEVLLSQIEHHVRLEQAAAQTFLDVPTADSLLSRTTSRLVN